MLERLRRDVEPLLLRDSAAAAFFASRPPSVAFFVVEDSEKDEFLHFITWKNYYGNDNFLMEHLLSLKVSSKCLGKFGNYRIWQGKGSHECCRQG